jgi:spore coat protein A, manganese oxidase
MRETWLPAGANRVFKRPGAKWIALMAAGLVGVAVLAAAYGSGNSGSSTVASAATAGSCRNFLTADDLSPARRFEDPLPIPNRLKPQYRKSDGTPVWVVHARAYTWKPAPGVCIPKWGYEDGTPGPTLVIRPHERSELLVYNELPQSLYNPYVDPFNQLSWVAPAPSPIRTYYTVFGEPSRPPPAPFNAPPYAQSQYELSTALTVHLHGGHQGPADDGYPMDTFEPGESHLYDYPNNQEATTLWYHDHDMDHTRGHVLMGLAGFYLIDDAKADAKLGLPSGGRCERNAAAQTNAKTSLPYFPTPALAPSTTPRTVPTRCRDIPIMLQQIPAELLPGNEFQPVVGSKRKPGEPEPTYRSVWTANSTLAPYLTVANEPYRFRFLNGNDEEPLKIWTTTKPDDPTSFAEDAHLQQVGTDGGLMNYVNVDRARPRQTKVRLFPAQRADVVIDFSKVRTKTTFYLQAQPQQAFVGGTRRNCLTRLCLFGDAVARTARPLIEFVVVPTVGTKPQAFAPPRGRLRGPRLSSPIKKLSTKTSTGRKVTERTFLFGFDGHVGRNPFATINGRFFTPTHSYATPVLNTTEIWHLVNSTDGYHPIHIHDIEFQVMSRKRCPKVKKNADGPSTAYDWCGKRLSKWTNIQPEPGDWSSCTAKRCELAWKDVFVIPPYSEVTIIGKFTDNLGLYVFHCHNLIHEDAGMMAQFEVVNARSSPARASARRRTAAMPAMPGMPAMAGTPARR